MYLLFNHNELRLLLMSYRVTDIQISLARIKRKAHFAKFVVLRHVIAISPFEKSIISFISSNTAALIVLFRNKSLLYRIGCQLSDKGTL